MSPADLDTLRALGLDDTAVHDSVQARFRDAAIEVTGDDLIHEASPELFSNRSSQMALTSS
jgi:hypothetical protein